MVTLEQLLSRFADPPTRYRPMMQWSWNGRMTPGRIREQVEQFAAQRCGGVFVYPRPGYQQAYLGEEWFELFGVALAECRRVGLECHIYDEFTCPGGQAGGHVVTRKPHLAAQSLAVRPASEIRSGTIDDVLMWLRRTESGMEKLTERPSSEQREDPAVHAVTLELNGLSGRHLPRADLLRRETTETFIETTHAEYAARFAESFGREIRFVFCDEPHLHNDHSGFACSRELLREFYKDHGYRLEEELDELLFAGEPSSVRYDYCATVNRLYVHQFMKPLHDWCERRGLLFTGHVMENQWPVPASHPDPMAALRYMQAPGTDLLAFQFFPTSMEQNKLYLLCQLMVRSLARQLGREWVMCESCGAAGYGYDVAQFKPLEDYLLALGVNLLDPHLTHETLAGMRKYEWPQTLSDHSPWWRWYHRQADHTSRVNALLSSGADRAEVLLLMPTTTAWLYAGARLGKPGTVVKAKDAATAVMQRIRDTQCDLALALYGAQLDVDLGDEFTLVELAEADGEALAVGPTRYRVVVLPPAMENVTSATLRWLEEYLAGGGRVVALGEPPARVDGRPSAIPAQLAGRYAMQWSRCEDDPSAVEQVRAVVPSKLAGPGGRPLPAELLWRRVDYPSGARAYFLANPWSRALKTQLVLPHRRALALNTADGSTESLAGEIDGDGMVVDLSLPAWGNVLWLGLPAQTAWSAPAVRAAAVADQPVELIFEGAQRRCENILQVDYCDAASHGRRVDDVATIHADAANWRWQGFDGTPWRGHQLHRNVMDRRIDPDSQLLVRYRFDVAEALTPEMRRSLRIAIERPWLYELRLNGAVIPQATGQRWFDEEVRAFPIGRLVQPGENELRLTAEPFHVLCEIMPVQVLGDFALEPQGRGFRLVPPGGLDLGDWTAQGLNFYHERVRYRFRFELAAPAERIAVSLPAWAGGLVEAHLDERSVGTILHEPYELAIEQRLEAGAHRLDLDVVGNMKNFMGPHFCDGLAGPWSWADCPAHMPAGERYRFFPVGLMKPPQVRVAPA